MLRASWGRRGKQQHEQNSRKLGTVLRRFPVHFIFSFASHPLSSSTPSLREISFAIRIHNMIIPLTQCVTISYRPIRPSSPWMRVKSGGRKGLRKFPKSKRLTYKKRCSWSANANIIYNGVHPNLQWADKPQVIHPVNKSKYLNCPR